jgi:phenylacetic acid degradation operon negative regulatory protein
MPPFLPDHLICRAYELLFRLYQKYHKLFLSLFLDYVSHLFYYRYITVTDIPESDIINGLILSLGRSEYTVAELKALCAPFGITDSSIRTWLSRRVRQGFLIVRREGRRSFYGLSGKGRRISSNISLSFRTPDWSDWDGSWRGFLFSIPESRKKERHRIRTKLSAYRFVPWYGGFWIRPKHEAEQIDRHFSPEREGANGRLITFQPQHEIRAEEVRQLWRVPQIQEEYLHGLQVLTTELTKLSGCSPEEAHVKRIEVGNRTVPLIYQDPLLPPRYLPEDWAGETFKAAFFQWDTAVRDKAAAFWKKIFEIRDQGEINES